MTKRLILKLLFTTVALLSSAFAQTFEFTPHVGGQINKALT